MKVLLLPGNVLLLTLGKVKLSDSGEFTTHFGVIKIILRLSGLK